MGNSANLCPVSQRIRFLSPAGEPGGAEERLLAGFQRENEIVAAVDHEHGRLGTWCGRLRGPLKVLQPPLQGLCLEARFERGQDEELAVQTYGKEAELLVVEVAARFPVVDGAPQVIGWQPGSRISKSVDGEGEGDRAGLAAGG